MHETLAYKDAVRLELSSRILQQFESLPVRDFIGRMERPSAASKKKSVLELIADGRELRTRLLGASEVRGADRVALCADAVQPYLQLVEPGGRMRLLAIPSPTFGATSASRGASLPLTSLAVTYFISSATAPTPAMRLWASQHSATPRWLLGTVTVLSVGPLLQRRLTSATS